MSTNTSTLSSTPVVVLAFLAGCATTLLWTTVSKRQDRSSADKNATTSSSNKKTTLPLSIRQEQLSRHTLYFGEKGVAHLKQSRVCVVGVGGVGSHAAHMLARSGLGRLQLIDFDQVTVSSLNRHACAVLADVGQPKVKILQEYLQKICPDPEHLRIDTDATMFTADTAEALLGNGKEWDMVVDCIDDIPTKTALVAYCLSRNIPIISCMSAGGKADPTRMLLTDLKAALKDPLATKLRVCLQKDPSLQGDSSYQHDMDRLAIMYSCEKTVVQLAEFTEEQKSEGVHNYGAVDGMRIRIVPVQGTMPALMGQAMAAYCMNRLSKVPPFQPATVETLAKTTRHKLYQRLRNQEQRIKERILSLPNISVEPFTDSREPEHPAQLVTVKNTDSTNGCQTTTYWVGGLQIDMVEDLEYLGEIWRNRCAITGARLGTVLQLARWDWSRPSSCDNLVLLSASVIKHFDHMHDPAEYISKMDPNLRALIERRLSACRVVR